MPEKQYGIVTPRLWTPPLRELTEETSLGFEVIEFAKIMLGVELYPWQQWLLIHALELLEDGQYRFKRVIVLVARQQGKTLLASLLATWWLHMDSQRHPDRVPPVKFKVVGVAQTLDIAREPWAAVKNWTDPDPDTAEDAELAIPSLQRSTSKVVDAHGQEVIVARSRAHYEIRAAKNARGKPAARILMDEMREQKDWTAWNAVSQTTKAFWGKQLWGFSNAGDATAVVLKAQRDAALAARQKWIDYVEAGITTAEQYANENDTSLGIFEWSAPDGCPMDDVQGILQANPSIGYGAMTVQDALADMPPAMLESGYRTEVLCQWVASRQEPFLNSELWGRLTDDASKVDPAARRILGICVSGDRSSTSVAVAGLRADGLIHTEVIAERESLMWVVKYAKQVRAKTGISEVAIQSKGVPSAELVQPLLDAKDDNGKPAPFTVHKIEGTPMLNLAGRMRDVVQQGRLRHLSRARQEPLFMAVENGTVRHISGMPVWDLFESPVDVAPTLAVNLALYALETTEAKKEKEIPPPPPPAVTLSRADALPGEANLASVGF